MFCHVHYLPTNLKLINFHLFYIFKGFLRVLCLPRKQKLSLVNLAPLNTVKNVKLLETMELKMHSLVRNHTSL